MKKILLAVLLFSACGDDSTVNPPPPPQHDMSVARDFATAPIDLSTPVCTCPPDSCQDSGHALTHSCQGATCVSSVIACQFGCDAPTGHCLPNPNPGNNQ